MAKVLCYKFLSAEINHGTEEEPNIEQIVLDKRIECKTKAAFDANYPIAEGEAMGEIVVDGEFEPENDTASADDVINALLGVTV